MTNDNEDEKDVNDDYEFMRSKYYNLVDKGEEAIDLMMDLARESEHPRAFEVLSNMMKQNAEITDRLMDLQKKKKEVKLDPNGKLPGKLTQNNVYIGSTTDLQRMLHNKSKEKQGETIDHEPESNQ